MSEQDFLRPFPVVIAPTQLIQSTLETPTAVTIIDREMIKAMNVREIPELMRRVPGVTVAYENGSNYFVAYQGLNDGFSRRMQVLVDGHSVYNLCYKIELSSGHAKIAANSAGRLAE